MPEATLDQVQRLAAKLSPVDQVRLLEYLLPRIARAVETNPEGVGTPWPVNGDAWQEFFRIGDAIAEQDTGSGETLTATLLAMRR